jgi:hypothetical protein
MQTQINKKIFLAITFHLEILGKMNKTNKKNTFKYKMHKEHLGKNISNQWFRVVYKEVW